MKPTKTMTERLAQIVKEVAEKELLKKIASKIDWDNVGKALDCRGKEYKISLEGDQVRLIGNGKNKLYPIDLSIPLLNIYDKQGNLISNSEDYD